LYSSFYLSILLIIFKKDGMLKKVCQQVFDSRVIFLISGPSSRAESSWFRSPLCAVSASIAARLAGDERRSKVNIQTLLSWRTLLH
jgi:hypothetical protein